MRASIDSIETFGLVDGPGIRTVIFFNSCKLRCLYCHNPEMWTMKDDNYSVDEIFNKIMRSKPYFGKTGGVTFSGGEPLLQSDFIIELCKKLKGEGINTCLDTAGVGNGNYDEILKYIDIVLLDIKQTDPDKYKYLTGMPSFSIFSYSCALSIKTSSISLPCLDANSLNVVVPSSYSILSAVKSFTGSIYGHVLPLKVIAFRVA